MQNTERQKFEESWKSAFDGAETTPPDRVWNSIELDLAGQESAKMKKRVVFYQRLAAALLLCSLVTGIYSFYEREAGGRNQEAEVRSQKSGGRNQEAEVRGEKKVAEKSEEDVRKTESNAIEPAAASTSGQYASMEVPTPHRTPHTAQPTPDNTQPTTDNAQPDITLDVTEPVFADETSEPTLAVTSPLLQENSPTEEIVQPKKVPRESNLWLALGASAGNYAPNTPSATMNPTAEFDGPALSFAAAPQKKPEPKVGSAYSVGMSVGKKFGRIVVQTGVNFAKQQIEYSSNYDTHPSNNFSSARAASYDYITTEGSSDNLSFTNTYTVNSTMEIVSIPVQAGYMIIDRKLGWQLNAGVSPDFFLRNIITDESGQRDRFTQSAGSESPYRSVNWSGLLNTELSYRIGTHYRLSLVPGVRYSFNSILKEPTDNGRPVILDIGFRFRYLFD
jgi:hypothetical protein